MKKSLLLQFRSPAYSSRCGDGRFEAGHPPRLRPGTDEIVAVSVHGTMSERVRGASSFSRGTSSCANGSVHSESCRSNNRQKLLALWR
jgi:hypothetical protein